mmetsp:Transcript_19716/g.65225  ORF Transcript_19716/g.65225 Transcript_19716/m.65225 type:complete len:228 (+) Transcript_19716:2299-2982(+)
MQGSGLGTPQPMLAAPPPPSRRCVKSQRPHTQTVATSPPLCAPVAARATHAVKSSPHDSDVASASVSTITGVVACSTSPRPNWPHPPAPHIIAVPSDRRTPACRPPVAIATAARGSFTSRTPALAAPACTASLAAPACIASFSRPAPCSKSSDGSTPPMPSKPHAKTSPSRLSATVEAWPQATDSTETSASAATRAGAPEGSRWPSCPSRPQPQVQTPPSLETAAEW